MATLQSADVKLPNVSESPRIAYLVSQYPAVNHTFVMREILGLRSMGFDVQVITIRGADRPAASMTETERKELAQTIQVLPFGAHFVSAHLSTFLKRPLRYLGGLLYALRM